VNGSARAYDVDIDGKTVTVMPYAPVSIDGVGEGEHTMTLRAAHLAAPHVERFTMEPTTFMLRALRDDVFVLNPDRSALLLHESMRYGREGDDDTNWAHALSGELVTHVDAHYVFTPFPSSIQEKLYQSNVRRRLSMPPSFKRALEIARAADRE
jgi:hypothetical protein